MLDPMELLTSTVRQDWPETSRRLAAEHARGWQGTQMLVVLSTLAALLFSFLRVPEPWLGAAQAAATFALFGAFALATVYAEREDGRWLAPRAYLVLAGGAIVARLAQPLVMAQGASAVAALALVALAPLASLALVYWSHRNFPDAMRRLGFTTERWPLWLLTGALVGGILGLHLWLNALFTPDIHLRVRPGLALSTWTTLYSLGVWALGEEMLFRGSGYLAVAGSMPPGAQARLVLRITLLNVLVYLVPASLAHSTLVGLYLLLYRAALAAVNTLLRHRCGSLVPGLASNIVFSALGAALGL